MTFDKIEEMLRELARSNYWQTSYSLAKETHCKLLVNERDFTYLQMMFLNYVGFYHGLYTDVALGDVCDLVIKDDIYADAYSYYRNQENKKLGNKPKPQNNHGQLPQKPQGRKDSIDTQVSENTWVFKKRPQGKK